MLPIYVISLASETARQRHIQEQLTQLNIDFQFMEAVDYRALSDEDFQQLSAPPFKKKLTRGEMGCALSHHHVYQQIIAQRQAYALVLEDDAKFIRNPLPLLNPDNLQLIEQQYPFDVLLIGYVKTLSHQLPFYYRRIPIKHRAKLHWENETLTFGTPWEQFGCGTVAYIISQQGAQKLHDITEKPIVSADNWLFFEKNCGLKILHTRPAFVLEALETLPSTIRQDSSPQHWRACSIVVRSLKGWGKNYLMNVLDFKK